jgi:hypothetical protein
MEITNGQPWQNSSQISVFWRGAKCHCQVAEFLQPKYKRMNDSKFRALNTLLNSAEYHYNFPCLHILPGHSIIDVPRSSLFSQISVCAPAKRARPGPSLHLSFLLLSGIGHTYSPCCVLPSGTILDQLGSVNPTCHTLSSLIFGHDK